MLRKCAIIALAFALVLVAASAFAKNKKAMKQLSADYAEAVMLVNDQNWSGAIGPLTMVIDNPEVSHDILTNALINRGSAYANQDMRAEAIADMNKVVELNPDMTGAYYNRARVLAMLNKHADAVADLTTAIELSRPGLAQADYYKNRGISYDAMSRFDAARADFAKAKELNPAIVIPSRYQ
jgi:tetratricopeptide (TPR) repeat protein